MRHLSVVAIVLAISVARALNSPPRPYLRRQERTTKRPTASQ